ncbi:MAG: response regulator [Candidatus Ozemobacteraceae bacterium]
MNEKLHLLIVEDNPGDVDLMREALPETGPIEFHCEAVQRLSEALSRLATGGIDLVISDLGLPDSQGLATFRILRKRAPNVAIIVLTDNDDQEMAIAAVREGAQDFLVKGQISGNLFVRAVRYAIERKRTEAEKTELESQNRQLQKTESLGRMASAIAHHFNNQLQAVSGNLEIAMDDLSRGTGHPIEFLTAAMQATHRASEVSSLMLTYLGKTHGEQLPLDLSEICRRNMPILRAAMPKNVVMEFAMPSPGPVIGADANQIQQVLTNLVTNAWEAANSGQCVIHVSIKTASPAEISKVHRFPIDSTPPSISYACLEVTDTGCGIADEDIEKLFDPFFSTKSTGRGLGLAAVLGIVRAHEGIITVVSGPDSGSTFRAYFPLTAEKLQKPSAQEDKVPKIPGFGTVLVVDDEEMIRTMASILLTRMGYSVLVAKDGVEAMWVLKQHKAGIRCVLCDLTMPRMNGWETLTALRQLAPGIPVILTSGYSEAQVMEGDHPELPQAFLGKPFRYEQLCEAFRQALANGKDL